MDTDICDVTPAATLGHIGQVRTVHTDTDANILLDDGWELLAASVAPTGTPTMLLGRAVTGCGCYTMCENPGDCPHPR